MKGREEKMRKEEGKTMRQEEGKRKRSVVQNSNPIFSFFRQKKRRNKQPNIIFCVPTVDIDELNFYNLFPNMFKSKLERQIMVNKRVSFLHVSIQNSSKLLSSVVLRH